MRITEDAMQDALLALCERGGSATVRNPDAFCQRTARNMELRARQRHTQEMGAWFELNGLSYAPLENLRAAWRDKAALRKLLNPEDVKAANDKYNASEAGKARRTRFRRSRGIPKKRVGRDPEKQRANNRAYRARQKERNALSEAAI